MELSRPDCRDAAAVRDFHPHALAASRPWALKPMPGPQSIVPSTMSGSAPAPTRRGLKQVVVDLGEVKNYGSWERSCPDEKGLKQRTNRLSDCDNQTVSRGPRLEGFL